MAHGHTDLCQALDHVAGGIEAFDARLLMPIHGKRTVLVMPGPQRACEIGAGTKAERCVKAVEAMPVALGRMSGDALAIDRKLSHRCLDQLDAGLGECLP